jgi:hypothetical protein
MLTEEISVAFNIEVGLMDLKREDFMTVESINYMVKRHKG